MGKKCHDRARTLYDEIWSHHLIERRDDGTCLIYVDRHLVHEVTSSQAFAGLRTTGRRVRPPDLTLAMADHDVPTTLRVDAAGQRIGTDDPHSAAQLAALCVDASDFGIPHFHTLAANHGVVHVVGPAQGFTLPGTKVVCGNSHTSAHGALAGAAAL